MSAGMLLRFSGVAMISGMVGAPSFAQSVEPGASAPVELDALTLRARATPSQLGLQSPTGANGQPDLPLGLKFRDDTGSVVKPLDARNGWAVGVGANPDAARPVELSPNSSLGLTPKPGARLLLEKRF